MCNICMEMKGGVCLGHEFYEIDLVCSHNITTSNDARAFIDVPSIAREDG